LYEIDSSNFATRREAITALANQMRLAERKSAVAEFGRQYVWSELGRSCRGTPGLGGGSASSQMYAGSHVDTLGPASKPSRTLNQLP